MTNKSYLRDSNVTKWQQFYSNKKKSLDKKLIFKIKNIVNLQTVFVIKTIIYRQCLSSPIYRNYFFI